jgi:hypothetical protein
MALFSLASMAHASTHPLSVYSVPPDLRSSTLAGIGIDLAAQINNATQGDVEASCKIIESMRGALSEDQWPQSKRERCAAELLASLHGYVTGPLCLTHTDGAAARGGGTRPKESQQQLHAIATAVHSDKIDRDHLVSAAMNLTGLSRSMWNSGKELRIRNKKAVEQGGNVSIGAERMTRSDAVDLDFMYDYFHNESADVEPNKQTKFEYTQKRIFCAGKWRTLKCHRRILTCSVSEAVTNAMNSTVYTLSGVTLHPKTIAGCICHCTKPATRDECTCPTCAEVRKCM